MITLYKTVLIETAEQAEALPVGTVGLPNPHDDCKAPYLKTGDGWISGWYPDWKRDGTHDAEPDAAMVGETALVPIEAEEVRVIEHGLIELDAHGQEVLYQEPTPGSRDYRRTEYHTPWEEA